jgi:hypothetical protein
MIYYGTTVQRRSVRLYHRLLRLVFCAVLAHAASARDFSECVTALVLPTTSVFSRNSPVGGVVMAEITIGETGKPSRLDLEGPNYQLKTEVRVHLEQSEFSAACAGKRGRIKFEFRLEGEPTYDRLPPKVIYSAPLSFTIVVRPAKPTKD